MHSATLERSGVTEIGLKSEMVVGLRTLGTGVDNITSPLLRNYSTAEGQV